MPEPKAQRQRRRPRLTEEDLSVLWNALDIVEGTAQGVHIDSLGGEEFLRRLKEKLNR